MSTPFDALDDFAGPGGWDEGARMIGLSTVGLEWDMAACQTAKTAGHARIRADVAAYPSHPFKGIRGYIASPPCQAWSMAGNRKGEMALTGQGVGSQLVLRASNNAHASIRPMHEPAPTLVFAHASNDVRIYPEGTTERGVQEVAATRHPESRLITIPEASILQSFPENYPWVGSRSKQGQQVGNAIPPLLAAHVLAAATGFPLGRTS